MDEEFVQIYLNKLASRVNELQQENLLMKSQLEHANMKLTAFEKESQGSSKTVREKKSGDYK